MFKWYVVTEWASKEHLGAGRNVHLRFFLEVSNEAFCWLRVKRERTKNWPGADDKCVNMTEKQRPPVAFNIFRGCGMSFGRQPWMAADAAFQETDAARTVFGVNRNNQNGSTSRALST